MIMDNPSTSHSLKTIQLNDQKAGMQNVDKEAINKIIYETCKGTPYFLWEEKKQKRIDFKIKEMLGDLEKFTDTQRKDSLKKMDLLCTKLESERDLSNSLVHIDMDAFYAAVEMRENPELKSKPLAVGSIVMLSTSNYEARKYGVRAGMAGFLGKRLCKELVIVPPQFDKYIRTNKQVMAIVGEYDPHYTIVSLDEVYFNLTDYIIKTHRREKHTKLCLRNVSDSSNSISDHRGGEEEEINAVHKDFSKCGRCDWSISIAERDKLAYRIVEEIRKRIFDVTALTASAGIAPNIILAKICSDYNKPNGQFQINSDINEVKNFISSLPVKKVFGIGPVQSQVLNGLGIFTCQDMYDKRDIVGLLFTQNSSSFYLRASLGLGSTDTGSEYIRKSIGVEETFKDKDNPTELHQKCKDLCQEMIQSLKSQHLLGKVVVLKIKTVTFELHTRHSTLPQHTADADIIYRTAKKLLDNEINAVRPSTLKLRLMGIRMSNLIDEGNKDKQTKLTRFLRQPTQPENLTVELDSYSTCPVCNKVISLCRSMFNDHVDNCLTGMKTSEPSKTQPERTEYTDVFCPVCGVEQPSDELSALNSHIDFCLSKGAIKDMLAKEEPVRVPTAKRKTTSQGPSGKKAKTEKATEKTIDSYFQT